MSSSIRLGLLLGLSTCALVLVAPACSSSTTDSPTTGATSTAAAVAGPAATFCAGKPVVVVSQAACHAEADAGHGHDEADAGEADGGAHEAAPEYGPTQYGSEGEDDECKYHVKWQATPVAVGSDVTFAVTATNRSDNTPLAGATPYAEIFLDATHPAPNTPVKTVEVSPGNYTIGPVRFDVAGNWNVRFHFHDECADSPESPHGHVAFFVKVP